MRIECSEAWITPKEAPLLPAADHRCSPLLQSLPPVACLPRDATLVDGSPCFPGHLLCDEGRLVRQDWWQADPPGGLPLLLHLLTLLPFRLIQDGRRQKSWRCQLSDLHPNKVYNLERSAGIEFKLETQRRENIWSLKERAKEKEIIVHEGKRKEGKIFEKEKMLQMDSVGRKLNVL